MNPALAGRGAVNWGAEKNRIVTCAALETDESDPHKTRKTLKTQGNCSRQLPWGTVSDGYRAPRIRGGQVPGKDQCLGRTTAVALSMKLTRPLRAGIAAQGPEKSKRRTPPDSFEGIIQDVPQEEFFPAEKKIAGIDRSVRHDPELRSACGTSDPRKLRIVFCIRDEA